MLPLPPPTAALPAAAAAARRPAKMVCSCGQCVAGILSPRMSLRIERTAASCADMITDSISWQGAAFFLSPC